MIGIHISKDSKVLEPPNKTRKTMLDAITMDTQELELGAFQIFTHGPQNSRKNKMDYTAIKKYCDKNKKHLYVHSAYLTTGIWNVNTKTQDDPKSKAAIKLFIAQLESCDELGSLGLVIHLPKKEPQVVIDTFEIMIPIFEQFKTPVLLEMTSVKPDPKKTYETPQKINRLTQMILEKYPKYTNWGWVPDTAHLWGAGIDISNNKIMGKWFSGLKYPKLIKLIHLNGGSIDTFATGKDKHMVVFGADDDIWNSTFDTPHKYSKKNIQKSSLYILAQFAKKYNIDCICEINRGDSDEIIFSTKSLKKVIES